MIGIVTHSLLQRFWNRVKNKYIPNSANESNQLADKDFVNSSINSVTARYLTYDSNGNCFSTVFKAFLGKHYYAGKEVTPTKNDYLLVNNYPYNNSIYSATTDRGDVITIGLTSDKLPNSFITFNGKEYMGNGREWYIEDEYDGVKVSLELEEDYDLKVNYIFQNVEDVYFDFQGNASVRFVYQKEGLEPGQWAFQYKVNDTPFTAAQLAAVNSGITKELVDKIGKGECLVVPLTVTENADQIRFKPTTSTTFLEVVEASRKGPVLVYIDSFNLILPLESSRDVALIFGGVLDVSDKGKEHLQLIWTSDENIVGEVFNNEFIITVRGIYNSTGDTTYTTDTSFNEALDAIKKGYNVKMVITNEPEGGISEAAYYLTPSFNYLDSMIVFSNSLHVDEASINPYTISISMAPGENNETVLLVSVKELATKEDISNIKQPLIVKFTYKETSEEQEELLQTTTSYEEIKQAWDEKREVIGYYTSEFGDDMQFKFNLNWFFKNSILGFFSELYNIVWEVSTNKIILSVSEIYAELEAHIGSLDNLTTTSKDNLVDAINEVNEKAGNGGLIIHFEWDGNPTGFPANLALAEQSQGIFLADLIKKASESTIIGYLDPLNTALTLSYAGNGEGENKAEFYGKSNDQSFKITWTTYTENNSLYNRIILDLDEDVTKEDILKINKALEGKQDSIFWATYNQTTFAEIIEAHNAQKQVICHRNDFDYILQIVDATHAYFVCSNATTSRQLVCRYNNIWGAQNYSLEDSSRKQSVITESDTNYPSSKAVVDYVGQQAVFERGTGTDSVVQRGGNNVASAFLSHAEGNYSTASGTASHAEGVSTTASGIASHAEGSNVTASGTASHAEGYRSESKGEHSHAENHYTTALGEDSHAEGLFTNTNNLAEHAEGKYNKSNANTIHSVGIGNDLQHRCNAHEIMNNGDHYIYGVGGYDGTNPESAQTLQAVINKLVKALETEELVLK